MNVTQTNFNLFYKEIQEYLPKADFCSIDFEMTGIKTAEYEMLVDMPYEKYLKLRGAANKYRIIQFGLCLYFRTGEKEFHARPYNAYIFPREHFRVSPLINIDVSAADFNTKHNMDWNAWFYEGITYMTLKDAKKRKTELDKEDQKPKYDPNNEAKLINEDDIKRSEEFVTALKAWIAENSKEPLVFTERSSFFRKHIYDVLGRDYPNLIYETIVSDEASNQKQIVIYNFIDENDKKLYEEKKQKEKDEVMFHHKGFLNVFELLVKAKKPLVGHNCYFDLLFLYSHFVETLPYSYDAFKKEFNKLFPEVYDTKFIVENTRFKNKIVLSSKLGDLAELCKNKEDPDLHSFDVVLDQEFKAYEFGNLENPRYHEAGYDAFLTGFAFAKMYYALNKEEQSFVQNSINSMRCLYYMKLGGADPMYKEAVIYVIKAKDSDKDKEKGNGKDKRKDKGKGKGKGKDKDLKMSSEDVLSKFEEHKIQDPLRFLSLHNHGFPGGLIILESNNEKQKELFSIATEILVKQGEEILSYQDYCKMRKVEYDKGNSKNA